MALFLIGYTIIALVLFLVIFIIGVSRGWFFKGHAKIKAIFANPLLLYSLRRIGSAFLSVMLAITCTYLLIRSQNAEEICQAAISNWDKMPEDVRGLRCFTIMKELGLTGSTIGQIFTYFYRILPFPKTLCSTETNAITDALGNITYSVTARNCRNFIMDLGKIYFINGFKNAYVIDVIFKSKMPHSFRIGIIAVIVELAIGYPAGVMMAKRKDGIFDKIGKAYIITIDAIPGIAYYYIWMTVFMLVKLPTTYADGEFLSYLAPSLTMGFTGMAGIALWVRRYMLDEFNSDYVKFARAKGLSENRIMFTHVLRNAIVPLVRSIPSSILYALLGSFYIEKIYSIPGLGGLLVTANTTNDFFALQGIVVVSALISIVSYLLGDITTALVDPRVSLASK